MKVLYDHQIFEHQRIGGVSRYFAEIIRNMPDDIDVEVSVQYSFNEYLKGLDIPFTWKDQLISYYSFLPNLNFKGKRQVYAYLQKNNPEKYPDYFKVNKSKSIDNIKKGDYDIFHPTFFEDYYLDYLNGKPYVLTVHDMIIELYPEFINSPLFIQRKKRLVDNAAHIIAVSENTKRDLIQVFGTAEDKISVVYHASNLSDEGKIPSGLPSKYLLYVGDRRLGYKNFNFFVSSIKPLLSEYNDLYIVCTGDKFTDDELIFFRQLGLEDRMHIIFARDNEMYRLYQSAQMFIYPSYYEGFGIPVLEAFQAGCPLVLANASCFPEVAQDAGLYFSPKSPVELRSAVREILDNKEVGDTLIAKGRKRLSDFSWQKSAMQTYEIYRKVLNERS